MEITPQSLFDNIQEQKVLNKQLQEDGIEQARAKNKYQLAFAKKILDLLDSDMAKTVILEVARGDKEIANLRFQKDAKAVVYDVTRERLYTLKKELMIMETIFKAEWSQSNRS